MPIGNGTARTISSWVQPSSDWASTRLVTRHSANSSIVSVFRRSPRHRTRPGESSRSRCFEAHRASRARCHEQTAARRSGDSRYRRSRRSDRSARHPACARWHSAVSCRCIRRGVFCGSGCKQARGAEEFVVQWSTGPSVCETCRLVLPNGSPSRRRFEHPFRGHGLAAFLGDGSAWRCFAGLEIGNAIPVSNRHLNERVKNQSDSGGRHRACGVKLARPDLTKAKPNSRRDSTMRLRIRSIRPCARAMVAFARHR